MRQLSCVGYIKANTVVVDCSETLAGCRRDNWCNALCGNDPANRQSDFALNRSDKTLGTPALPAFMYMMDKARLFRLRLGTGKAHCRAAFDTLWFDGEALGIVFRHCSSLGGSFFPGLISVIEKANPHLVSSKPN
jgi:hypothetical protein